MSRYPNVRHKPKQEPQPSEEQRRQQAVTDTAHALYREQGGELLDDNIKAAHKTVQIYTADLERSESWSGEKPFQWRVTPSAFNRASVQLERLRETRNKLLDDCFQTAKQMILRWVEATSGAAAEDSSPAPARPVTPPQAPGATGRNAVQPSAASARQSTAPPNAA